jgi:hypothetical protein
LDYAGARMDADFIPIRDDPRFEQIMAGEKKLRKSGTEK